ncbi:acid-sensing ion channel 2-like [Dendronephthya gigantea]|uniref:acid-sensing ion channel 2-like n=1 Tax=Dendronephthya gigantea TaxID=151771 RepID=UPI00106CF8DB|nr:acid-sensing ion channel 2-like [Dendronephthya gigantea]
MQISYRRLRNTTLLPCVYTYREDVYHKTISSSRWPSKSFKSYLESQNLSIESGTLTLSVFYSDLNYEKIEEKFSYGTTNLLADIGGQLGLWIGISVLTVCELLELILKLVSLAYAKFKIRNDDKRVNME